MTANVSAISNAALKDPQAVVEAFFSACCELDFDKALEFLDEECVYKNMPFHTAKGKARVRRDLNAMAGAMNLFQVEMINIAVNGDVVLTERVDTLGGRFFKAAIPLMGVLVVKNGKITEWRDYFDWAACFGKVGGSLLTQWAK